MIPDDDDLTQPRYLRLTLTDNGQSWLIDIDRNRINATDDDVCSLINEAANVLAQMHDESHIAKDLAERRN